MGGNKSAGYLARKLRQDHIDLNVDGKKAKVPSADGALSVTARLLNSGFADPSSANKSTKQAAAAAVTPASNSDAAQTRGQSAAVAAVAAAASDVRSAAVATGPTPFTPAARKGRKRKDSSSTDARESAISPSIEAGAGFEATDGRPSSSDLGSRRLLPEDILNLNEGNEIALVVPVDRKEESIDVKLMRANVKKRIKTVIIASERSMFRGVYGRDKDLIFNESIVRPRHTVQREGRLFCEFSATENVK